MNDGFNTSFTSVIPDNVHAGEPSEQIIFQPQNVEDSQTFEFNRYYGDVFDLARAFLSIAPMTDKKLQKLCYYAKAWYLALTDENLIEEQFEAWVHGAVQPKLYQMYRTYGFAVIPQNQLGMETIPEGLLSFAHEVYAAYGDLTGDQLEQLNHSEMPWIKARQGLMPWQPSNKIIEERDMKEYYRSLLEKEA